MKKLKWIYNQKTAFILEKHISNGTQKSKTFEQDFH